MEMEDADGKSILSDVEKSPYQETEGGGGNLQ